VRDNEGMPVVHITEAELARDTASVLERVRQGAEVIVEHEHRPVARITPVRGPGRPIAECIAIAEARGSKVTLDEEFGRDMQEIIAGRRPLDTSAWE
jgi:antitoxin (DNA-binding transcriptional repressor) of toxin-antitoxin stability system